jgi:hypothetical protein
MPTSGLGRGNETSRFHRTVRRRGVMAARGSRTAARRGPTHRRADRTCRKRSGSESVGQWISARSRKAGMVGGTQSSHRLSICAGGRSSTSDRERAGSPAARGDLRDPDAGCRRAATGDPRDTNRVRCSRRPGRLGLHPACRDQVATSPA